MINTNYTWDDSIWNEYVSGVGLVSPQPIGELPDEYVSVINPLVLYDDILPVKKLVKYEVLVQQVV